VVKKKSTRSRSSRSQPQTKRPRKPEIAATQYARAVLAGEIIACKWVKLACERHLGDLKRSLTAKFPYRFDKQKAEAVCNFAELMVHIKGAKAGQPIVLELWQKFFLQSLFGWIHKKTGKRRFRRGYLDVARKNAKSTLAAIIGLYMMVADAEGGAEIYSAATKRDQARIIFDVARHMVRKCQGYRETFGVQLNAHNISQASSASKFEPLSAEADTLDGLNIHCALVDELHAHRTREIYDVLETGTGARDQSLLLSITTAGKNRAGICYEIRTYLTKILDRVGDITDDSFFGIIYTLDEEDDWSDVECLKKANPNWGISVNAEDIARLAYKALQTPAARNNFKTKHANVWVSADVAWMDMRAWDGCADPKLAIEQFTGQPCTIGVDMASKVDIAATMRVFHRVEVAVQSDFSEAVDSSGYCQERNCINSEQGARLPGPKEEEVQVPPATERNVASVFRYKKNGRLYCEECRNRFLEKGVTHFYAFGHNYLPESAIEEDVSNSQYAGWVESGFITATPGAIIDFEYIELDMQEWASTFQISEVAYDPFQATQFSTRMSAEGFTMVEMRPTVLNFSEPMKELEALVLSGRFHHTGDPVLAWAVSNVVCHLDKKDNIYPTKERPENKIDPVVALIMALARAILGSGTSVYNSRGLLTI
jgi:phage terminase large subunit-like protein